MRPRFTTAHRRLGKAALLCALALSCRRPGPPPNLLLITIDTLRADALDAAGLGETRTPNLDRLAREGTTFDVALTPLPRTTPAIGSLLTGLWPFHHGSREVGDPIRPVTTLAEILEQHGYATLAVSANSTAGPKQNLDRGFRRFVTRDRLVETYGEGLFRDPDGAGAQDIGWATAVTREGLGLVEGLRHDGPFFLWLFYYDPHMLYRPPGPWRDVEAARCWELYRSAEEGILTQGQIFSDLGGVASRAAADCRRLYQAEVAYVDHEIGALLEGLAARGLLEQTLIVLTADHGENFGEGGLYFEHGDNAREAALHVPYIWRGPGVARGRRDVEVVSLVDTVPTILSLLGLGSEKEKGSFDGIALADRLRSGTSPSPRQRSRVVFAESATAMWNDAFGQLLTGRKGGRICINDRRYSLCGDPRDSEVLRLYDHLADPRLELDLSAEHPEVVARLAAARGRWAPEEARQRVARTGRFKLVQFPRLEGGYEARLFDLEADPGEATDVRHQYPRIYARLLAELEHWGSGAIAESERRDDDELEDTLRSLGYLP